MNPQIEQLRKQFNGYNNAQKKDFIDKLKIKLQGNRSPEYAKFLNECVSNYNAAIRGGASSNVDLSDLLDNVPNAVSTQVPIAKGKTLLLVGGIFAMLFCFWALAVTLMDGLGIGVVLLLLLLLRGFLEY